MTATEGRLRISIADDHRMFLEALRLILEETPSIEVVSTASNGGDLLRDIKQLEPDIALVDISMDGPGFAALAAEVGAFELSTRLVALTMHLDRDLADRAILAGFSGYVVKDDAVAELVQAIHAASEGRVFISRSVLELGPSTSELKNHLTRRETACLESVAKGRANRDIAKDMGISERTVKFHLENVFRKLKVKSRGEAVAVARQMKLI